jgi:hypothetical protein
MIDLRYWRMSVDKHLTSKYFGYIVYLCLLYFILFVLFFLYCFVYAYLFLFVLSVLV